MTSHVILTLSQPSPNNFLSSLGISQSWEVSLNSCHYDLIPISHLASQSLLFILPWKKQVWIFKVIYLNRPWVRTDDLLRARRVRYRMGHSARLWKCEKEGKYIGHITVQWARAQVDPNSQTNQKSLRGAVVSTIDFRSKEPGSGPAATD